MNGHGLRRSVLYEPPVEDILRAIAFVQPDRADAEVRSELVREFARLASEVIAPSDAVGDSLGARLETDGTVSVPAELAKAHRAYVDGGWAGAAWPEEIGGGGLGQVMGVALLEMYASANLALSLNAVLTQGAVEALSQWASPEQRSGFLVPLVSGEWSGTMHLTEPQAGSDVGALRARAEPTSDGRWRLTGTKIFITWGEHDLTENIVHLVLARTPGSPEGTRGISLFVVPKMLPNGTRNDVRCVGLEGKLGIHASPTCVIDLDGAVGELVGEEHGGMRAMFTMMNAARLAIGLQGLAIGERSRHQALTYALERRQGQRPDTPAGEQAPIAEHPDVRRMLADLRATTRAMRLVLYTTAAMGEAARSGDERARRRADLLTPIAKAWCTDHGFRLASEAVQVHGGMGYIEEAGIAQRLRDARIGPIYEGTNGIQAIDLVTRKVIADDGQALSELLDDLEPGAWTPGGVGDLDDVRAVDGIGAVRAATAWLLDHAVHLDDVLAGATPFLELVGTVTAGAMLAELARRAANNGDIGAEELVDDARFFIAHRVSAATGLVHSITAGATSLPRF